MLSLYADVFLLGWGGVIMCITVYTVYETKTQTFTNIKLRISRNIQVVQEYFVNFPDHKAKGFLPALFPVRQAHTAWRRVSCCSVSHVAPFQAPNSRGGERVFHKQNNGCSSLCIHVQSNGEKTEVTQETMNQTKVNIFYVINNK